MKNKEELKKAIDSLKDKGASIFAPGKDFVNIGPNKYIYKGIEIHVTSNEISPEAANRFIKAIQEDSISYTK